MKFQLITGTKVDFSCVVPNSYREGAWVPTYNLDLLQYYMNTGLVDEETAMRELRDDTEYFMWFININTLEELFDFCEQWQCKFGVMPNRRGWFVGEFDDPEKLMNRGYSWPVED